MTTTTSDEELAACLERGVWYGLVDPSSGDFWGRWLDARGPEEFRRRHGLLVGLALQVCLVTRISPPGQFPVAVRVQNLESPRWRRPR